MNAPFITIGVTCFNAAGTIERAVASALAQEWPNKEIVIVDDASTDESGDILRRLARRHPEIRLLLNERNAGVAEGRNIILQAARGEYVAYFDDDDESRPDRLRSQWRRLRDHEARFPDQAVFCFTNRAVVRAGETKAGLTAKGIGYASPEPPGPAVADHLFGVGPTGYSWGMLGTCTLMARRSDLLDFGGFDPSFRRCAEWDFAIRAGLAGAHFISVDEPLVTQHKTASADKSGATPLKYALALRRKHRRYLEERNAYLASVAFAHAQFHGNANRKWKSRFFANLGRIHLAAGAARTSFARAFVRKTTKLSANEKPIG